MSATQSVHSRQRGVIRCHGNALRLLIPVFAAAAIVLTGTAARAGTNDPPSAGVTGFTPVLTGPIAKVTGHKPVLTAPKHHVHLTSLPRTGGLYTAGLEGGAGLLVVGGVLMAVGRKPSKIAA